jgi:hypothetical protein
MDKPIQLRHIFIDHSNVWGGARLATRINNPEIPDRTARISVENLDKIIGGNLNNVFTKIVSGGIPPGMEGVWAEYHRAGYDTQRLFRDENWKERGVDHSIIGHMWRLLATRQDEAVVLVLVSGDGSINEFGTSFYEVLETILKDDGYVSWNVELYSFDWVCSNDQRLNSPTAGKMKRLIRNSSRGSFHNLFDDYEKIVYHEKI